SDILAKSRRQRTMCGRIVKRERLIVVRAALRDVARAQKGSAHETMAYHERDARLLFLSKRKELRRKLPHHVAVERHVVRDPEAVKDREQQQGVFGRLTQRFSSLDQQTSPLRSRLSFRRGIAFHMEKRGHERDLNL